MMRISSTASLLTTVLGLFCSIAVLCTEAAWGADLPTGDEILKIYEANKQQLAHLHLQLVHRYETTEAACRIAQLEADRLEKMLGPDPKKAKGIAISFEGGFPSIGNAPVDHLRKQLEFLRNRKKPYHVDTHMEFFRNGEDYQFRKPVDRRKPDEETTWIFSTSDITAETLLSDYREVSIYSRSAKTTPAARWWHASAGRHAYIMNKHLHEIMSLHLSPYTEMARPSWDRRHPYDVFFSLPADQYRVVRQEEVEGRLLTVVDVAVPIDKNSRTLLAYRGWLDLARGAIPLKMHHRQNAEVAPVGQFDCGHPSDIITTHNVKELQPRVFYPVKIVSEHFWDDPDAPALTEAEKAEVRAGTRIVPKVVENRNIWDCSLVEIKTDYSDDFFVIPFPKGQQLYDHDAGKMVGALDEKPLVKVGQPAPPLSIARWVDGKQRTLEDLKGQVVVLDFWGLWCGACRSSVDQLKQLQQRFEGQPVTFISIHTAEADTDALTEKIVAFKKSKDWKFMGAIDQGTMVENSVTANAYGCQAFPLTVIIGPDGRIVYVDPQDITMACDEEDPKVIAAFNKKFNKLMKERFEAVGETWPVSRKLDEQQQTEIHQRVGQAYLVKKIESALETQSK